MMRVTIAALALLLGGVGSAFAAGGGDSLCDIRDPQIDLTDKASLQRGARLYVNYCLGCHSLQYQRYSRLAEDLNIPDELVEDHLMFTGEKIGDQMTIAMPEDDSEAWFGTAPPDLTLKSRVRGEDWLYSYLLSFYKDDSKTWGVNNLCFPDVGMPHVLAPLQGIQEKHYESRLIDGEYKDIYTGLAVTEPGSLSEEEYEAAMRDLVAFMSYVGEPVQTERRHLGVWVLLFLGVFFVFAYLLKREYWKDIH